MSKFLEFEENTDGIAMRGDDNDFIDFTGGNSPDIEMNIPNKMFGNEKFQNDIVVP